MFFELTVAAAASLAPSRPARATVRVLVPARVSEELWRAHERPREVIMRDEQGG